MTEKVPLRFELEKRYRLEVVILAGQVGIARVDCSCEWYDGNGVLTKSIVHDPLLWPPAIREAALKVLQTEIALTLRLQVLRGEAPTGLEVGMLLGGSVTRDQLEASVQNWLDQIPWTQFRPSAQTVPPVETPPKIDPSRRPEELTESPRRSALPGKVEKEGRHS